MKKILTVFFLSLGIIFFLILVAIVFIFFTDTFGIKSLLINSSLTSTKSENINIDTNKNPLLSASQEKALEAIGIDPAKLPTKITPEMLVCFDAMLGNARTLEIKNGSSPTATDFIKARSCI